MKFKKLFNKELLDLRVPLPALLRRFVGTEAGKGRMLTRALEWNLRFCLMEYLFDAQGRVRKVFLKGKNGNALIDGYVFSLSIMGAQSSQCARLKRRLIFMGILNAIFAPFIVLYLLMYSFFRYFEVCLELYVLHFSADFLLPSLSPIGVSQEPVEYKRETLYPLRPMEVPRVQRAAASLYTQAQRVLPDGEHVYRPIPEREAYPHSSVRSVPYEMIAS